MITAITVENFKSIRDQTTVELKPITLLFGPNSAGKSTVLQAFLYAYEIFARNNTDPRTTVLGGDKIDLGGFRQLVYQHDLKQSILLKFEFSFENGFSDYLIQERGFSLEQGIFKQLPFDETKNAWIAIEIHWNPDSKTPQVQKYEIGINEEFLSSVEIENEKHKVELNLQHALLNFQSPIPSNFEQPQKEKERILEFSSLQDLIDYFGADISEIRFPRKNSALPKWDEILKMEWEEVDDSRASLAFEQTLDLVSALLVSPGRHLRNLLRQFLYLGPIREIPPDNYEPLSFLELSRWASGLGAWDKLGQSDEKFVHAVNSWMLGKDQLDTGYSVKVRHYKELENISPIMTALESGELLDLEMEDIQEELDSVPEKTCIVLTQYPGELEVAPQAIGVGISQILPVVVTALTEDTKLVAIEQPELHLHPAIQVSLGDLFINQLHKNPDKFFLLETHSEHLLLRLLRRIGETTDEEAPFELELTSDQVAIYFIEIEDRTDPESHTSYVSSKFHRIRIDETGEFKDEWPRGFFEERNEELFG